MKFWKEGDTSRGICAHCRRIVETRCEYRPFRLEKPKVIVPDVLVGVCTICDQIVSVPHQSSARLNAERRKVEHPLEARLPAHLLDVLAVVANHYGRPDPEFRLVVLRYYLHLIADDERVAQRVSCLAKSELARGRANRRLSMKMYGPLLHRAVERARNVGIRYKSSMLRGAIVAAAEDLESRNARRRRQTLAEMAATV